VALDCGAVASADASGAVDVVAAGGGASSVAAAPLRAVPSTFALISVRSPNSIFRNRGSVRFFWSISVET